MNFPSGIRLNSRKEMSLSDTWIRTPAPPRRVLIPSLLEPLVRAGDFVLRGQKIAEAAHSQSAPVHASISGRVVSMEYRPHPQFGISPAIEIESDGNDRPISDFGIERRDSELEALTPEEIHEIALEAGISEDRLNAPVQTLILNGSESEPYLTADHVLMLAKPVEILRGLEFMMRAFQAGEAYIAVSEDKLEAYELIASKIFTLKIPRIRMFRLRSDYPQGFDFQLVRQILGKEIPVNGNSDGWGGRIFPISTAFAFYEAVKYRKPFIERVVTVSGACVAKPQNIWVRIGTLFQDVFSQCGGLLRPPARVIMGGPMMGLAQPSLEIPILKITPGILALSKEETSWGEAGPCIRCGDCISVCPVSLNPVLLVEAARNQDWKLAERYFPGTCIECGNCSYVCPSNIPMVEWIRMAKGVRSHLSPKGDK